MQKTVTFMIAVTFLALASVSNAAQRMGIARGSYSLSPKGTARIKSYCMDYSRSAPSKETSYRHVLTDPRSTSVRVGTGFSAKTMPLQQAIDQQIVEIEGINITFERMMEMMSDPDFLRRMSPKERAEVEKLNAMYKALSPTEQKQLAKEAEAAMGVVGGDYTGLNFRNKSSEPIEIIVNNPMVLGESKESIDLLDPSSIGTGDQGNIWQINNSRHKTLLSEAGVKAANMGDDGYKAQIEKFQTALDLPKTKEIDETTELALRRVHAEQSRVSQFNADANNYAYVTFEASSGGSTDFRAFFGKGEDIYRGNSLNDVLRRANDRGKGNTLYVDLTEFGSSRIEVIKENLTRLQVEIAPNRTLHVIDRQRLPTEKQRLLFEPGIERVSPGTLVVVSSGPRKGWFKLTLDFVKKTGETLRIHLVASSRRALELFQTQVIRRIAKPTIRSPLDEIIFIKSELKKQGINSDDIKAELDSVEVAGRELVHESRPAA